MLLSEAIELLRADIEGINWVEKYGGLVQSVTYKDKDFDSGATNTKVMPISCTANTSECNDPNAFYTELVPNDAKLSILYFETLQALTFTEFINGFQNFQLFTGRARLVGWMNTKRLGLRDCFLSSKLIMSLFPSLSKEFKVTTGPLSGSTVQFKVIGEVEKNENIFSRYTYDLDQQYLIYPYDYFAIDVEITASIKTGCGFEIEVPFEACWVGEPENGSIPADYLGDSSGEFTGVQKYSDVDCEYSSGNEVSFVIKSLDRDNNNIVLGTFIGAIGDTLNDSSKWDTAFNIYDYVSNTLVGDGQIFGFDKLQFAQDFSFINLASKEIFIEIRKGQPDATTAQPEQILYIFREDLPGLFNYPFYLRIYDDKLYISEFLNETISQSGFWEGGINFLYSKRNATNLSDVRHANIFRIDQDAASPTLYYVGGIKPSGGSRGLYKLESTGVDSDNLLLFPPTSTNTGFVRGLAISSYSIPEILDQRANGEPIVIIHTPTGGGTFIDIYRFNGATWDTKAVNYPAGNIGTAGWGDFFKVGNTIYIVYSNVQGAGDSQIKRISYASDPFNDTWSEEIIVSPKISAILDGTGDVAGVNGAQFMAVDTVNLVNGQPRIYVSYPLRHIIQMITANTTNPTGPEDWDVQLVIGVPDVPGNDNLQGTNCRLTQPHGMFYYQGYVYFCQRLGAQNIKRFNANPTSPDYLLVEEFKGTFGSGAITDFVEF